MYNLLRLYPRYWYVLFCMFPLSKEAALPPRISTNTNLNLIAPTATNLSDTWGPDLPNDDFDYSARYYGAALPDIACMMVCVFAMRELALLPDFSGRYWGKTWIRDGYPQVAMSVSNPGDMTTVRWAMWTIAAGIRDMLLRNHFQTSEFVGKYIGIRIGVVKFFAPDTIKKIVVANRTESVVPQIAAAASMANHKTATVSVNLRNSDLNTTSNDDELWASLTYRTKDIPRGDIFMAIIWMLLNLAPHQNDERVLVLTVTAPTITTAVTTKFIRVKDIPPRVDPLMYGNLVSLLAKTPEVLLRENRFCEMDIVVKDDGASIGVGTIRATVPSGSVGFPLTANVSMS